MFSMFRKTPLAAVIGMIGYLPIGLVQANVSVPESPFAAVPLNLQQTTIVTTGNRPKSNMMLFIDDSGSMRNWVGATGKTRMEITKEVLTMIVDKYEDQFNWFLYELCGDGGCTNSRPVNGSTPMTIDQTYDAINDLWQIGGSTPATRQYVNSAKWLMEAQQYRCQKAYIVMMSDGGANGTNTVSYGGYYSYFKTNNYWTDNGYSNTGGSLIGSDYDEGISYFSQTLLTKDFKNSADGNDIEGYNWDDPGTDPDNPIDKQVIRTFTIGFGTGIGNNACRYLRNGASPSPALTQPTNLFLEPTCPDDNKGRFFFKADDTATLFEAFDTALASALVESESAAGQNAVSTSTPATAGTKIPELGAYFSLDTGNWGSVLYFNVIDEDGNIDSTDQKTVKYYYTKKNGQGNSGLEIIVNQGFDENGDEIRRWIGDTNNTPDFYGINTNQEVQLGLIPWLRRDGNVTDEEIEANVAANAAILAAGRTVPEYRIRTDGATEVQRMMGDVIGSPTISLGKDGQGRDKYIVTAANDGLVHIFVRNQDASTEDEKPYQFALAYLPGAMQRESADSSDTVAKALPAVASVGYGENAEQPHLYLNDGGIVYRTTAATAGAGKQSFIVGAMGKGGRGVYALNIAGYDRLDPSAAIALDGPDSKRIDDVPLWETKKGSDNYLGYTVGTPQVGQMATQWAAESTPSSRVPVITNGVRFYAWFGNGYETNNAAVPYDSEPTLYAYEALGQEAGTSGALETGDAAGTEVIKIETTDGYGGLATPTLVDTDFDGIVDVAYAGDYGGNMYRFNLQGTPAEWSAVKIYKGISTVDSDYPQPITSAPAVYRRSDKDFVVIFGTGSDLYQEDLDDKSQQMIAGIFDNINDLSPTAVGYDDLVEQTIESTDTKIVNSETKTYRYLSNNPVGTSSNGWRLMLDNSIGERVVVKPEMLLSTAYVTTRGYNSSSRNTGALEEYTCLSNEQIIETEGVSWLMAINALTGGTPSITDGSYFNSDSSAGGIQTVGLASAAILYTTSYTGSLWATTVNGDAGGNGLGALLVSSGVAENVPDAGDNQCLTSSNYQVSYADQEGIQNISISGTMCPTAVLRLNYREAPL